jgi:hypothetical protein
MGDRDDTPRINGNRRTDVPGLAAWPASATPC